MNLQYTTLLVLLLANSVVADSEIPPFAKVDRPIEGSCYIKQIPEQFEYVTGANNIIIGRQITEEAFVSAFKIDDDGEDQFLWSSVGWYAHKVFLSPDCEYLVRMGNWARGATPSQEDLAVAFYKNGELLRSYSTADMIKNKDSVSASVSHYFWQADDADYPEFELWADSFSLKTIEGTVFKFNYKTGAIENH